MQATASAPAQPNVLPRAGMANGMGTVTGSRSSFLSLIAYFLSIAILLYVFTFNFLPTDIRLAYAGIINVGYAALFVLSFSVRRPGPILCIIGISGLLLVEAFNGSGVEEEVSFAVVRQFSSLIGYAAFLLVAPLVLSAKQCTGIALVTLLCVVLALFQAMYNDPVEVADTFRLGSVTGGLDLMHPSAYAVAGITLIAAFLAFSRKFNPKLGRTMMPFWAVVAIALVITLEGFGVRTIFIMLASFFGFYLIYSPRNRTILAWSVPISLMLFLFFAIYVVDKSFWLANVEVGSGRIGAYVQRFEIFAARGFEERVLGSGIGSDYFYGKYQWRHGEKDSHNDYLSMLIELGALGLVFFGIYVVGLFMMSVDRITFAITCMILMASLVSNAALFRPNLGTLFGIAALVGRSLWVIHKQTPRPRTVQRPVVPAAVLPRDRLKPG